MEGDTIFDPFMGVGSIGQASLNLNRNFIGIEISEKYFQAAQKRLKLYQSNISHSNSPNLIKKVEVS